MADTPAVTPAANAPAPAADKYVMEWFKDEATAKKGKHKDSHRLFNVTSPNGPNLWTWAAPVAAPSVIAKYAQDHLGVVLDWEGKGVKTVTKQDIETGLDKLSEEERKALLAKYIAKPAAKK